MSLAASQTPPRTLREGEGPPAPLAPTVPEWHPVQDGVLRAASEGMLLTPGMVPLPREKREPAKSTAGTSTNTILVLVMAGLWTRGVERGRA